MTIHGYTYVVRTNDSTMYVGTLAQAVHVAMAFCLYAAPDARQYIHANVAYEDRIIFICTYDVARYFELEKP